MKKALFGLLLAGAVFAGQARAQSDARGDLWCYTTNVWVAVDVCSSHSLQQCLQSRPSASGSCFMNPKYAQVQLQPEPQQRKKK